MLYPLIALGHFSMLAVGGASRYYFVQWGLLPLGYLTNVVIVLAVAIWMMVRIGTLRFGRFELIVVCLLMASTIVALLTGKKLTAIAFGFYIFTPFLFGVIGSAPIFNYLMNRPKIMLVIWIITFFGLCLDSTTSVPWSGFSFDVGGVSVSASREWTFEGARRVAGFARTSFDASAFLLVSAIFVVSAGKSKRSLIVIWLLTGVGIALTTTKGLLLAYFITTLVWLLRKTGFRHWLGFLPVTLGILVVVLPLLTFLFNFSGSIDTGVLGSLFGSFLIRLAYTWPDAWTLLQKTGNAAFGTGLGGIGTPQMLFEPNIYNSADNIFIYGLFVFGIFIIPVLYWFVVCAKRQVKIVGYSRIGILVFQLALIILTYGITTNVIELGAISVFFGALCRWFYAPESANVSS